MTEIPKKRDLINRRQLAEQLASLAEDLAPSAMEFRNALLAALKTAHDAGRAEIRRRFEAGTSGHVTVAAGSYLVDQILRALYDVATGSVYPATNPTASERLSVVAVGGYGRDELAPASDIDLLFLLPYKQTPWSEQVIEFMLYILWDLKLKVGHSVRSVDDCIRLAGDDVTIKTAMLEARYIWGDQGLFVELKKRFADDVVAGSEAQFIEEKMAERDNRHQRMGDSRYVLEPNIKEGKGGMRDLQTLFWIGKYVYHVDYVAELVEKDLFTAEEARRFRRAEGFLRTVRCHLHYLTGRAEERLTFDLQPELAARLGYADRASGRGIERFMKHYYLVAKTVGDLTRIFCAAVEAQHKRRRRLRWPIFRGRSQEIEGFSVDGDRLNVADEGVFREAPAQMIALFHAAHEHDLDVHPNALRHITRNLKYIDARLRKDETANRLFLELLSHRRDPEIALRRMNEAGVLGRFVPDFGRVVAQMQHDMYHVYTVDEHTIRAIGILAKIENGTYGEDHPLSVEIIKKIKMRRALYVAVMLHDIAKGRGGDHSVLGAEVAEELCPRLGMEPNETEMVAWLVRSHLLMSAMAFKRDLDDPKTIADFVDSVQSLERLRLLLVLTVADIRAVGPGVRNGWKGQLLRDLYFRAEEIMLGGDAAVQADARAARRREDLRAALSDWPEADIEHQLGKGNRSYWLAADLETHVRWANLMRRADQASEALTIDFLVHEFESVTEITVYTPDHPGLFTRLSGALSICGANIADARILTTSDGMALDVFWVQDMDGQPISDAGRTARLKQTIEQVLHGELPLRRTLAAKRDPLPSRANVFKVEPLVIFDNEASNTHTVIEANGRDRPALLHDLTRACFDLSLGISNARISTYGERAVDVFYVKDLFGLKIRNETKLQQIRDRMLEALSPDGDRSIAPQDAPGAVQAVGG